MSAKALLAPFVSLLGVIAASGLLYLANPSLPGPQVADALPFDELARHASVSLLWFVAVWTVVGLAAGLYARWARLERTIAALLLALTVGFVSYVDIGLSLAVVRQISLRDALDIAARMHVVYLPGLIVGLETALLAAHRNRPPVPILVSCLVAIGAALDLLHATLPGADGGLLRPLTPDAAMPLTRAAAALTAIALLATARGLARQRRRAWQVATLIASASTALHVIHGLNDGTLVSAIVLLVLLARRHDFPRQGGSISNLSALARLVTAAGAIALYGTSVLWLNRLAADRGFSLSFALHEVANALTGRDLGGSAHLAAPFSEWFPLSILLLEIAGALWAIEGWIAPWRHRVVQADGERERARQLVRAFGADTLAPFVLRSDKAYFFSRDGSAFLAYRVVNRVAIVSGDPIGPSEQVEGLVETFAAFARERGWRIAILGASEHRLPLYAKQGLHAMYHGDEAIVDAETFSLEGRAVRKVRQSVSRLDQAGYHAEVLRPSQFDAARRAELRQVAADWRGSAPERGFVMALDALFALGDGEALFVLGTSPDGRVAGFLHFAVSPAGKALSLSSMPRLRTTPNGFNEWLISAAISWAKTNGYKRISLNFAPFAALLSPEAKLTRGQRVQRNALLSLKGHFQLDNLLAFNRKFFPTWERRFVVYEHRRDLPRVGVAALAAEAYLPFQRNRR